MINKVTLIGRLGRDPETRQATNTSITNLRIATDRRTKDARGEWKNETDWHSVVTFGNTADNCAKYLTKGRLVYVEGRLQTRSWEDKDGVTKWATEVVAYEVKFLGGGDDRQVPRQTQHRSSAPVDESDLPF
jgi:single-strand DNA-binding protein